MKKIIILTEGGIKYGLGHLMRCIAMAHMLKDSFDIAFVCQEIPDKIEEELTENQFGILKLTDEITFLNKLNSEDIVVLDGYNFDTEYQKRIKKYGCKLVCIDDLHDKEFFADLIINHAPGVTVKDYQAQPYTQYALGLEYALLRPAFLEQAQKERKIKKIETVLICFGGSDIKNLTERTLSTVLTFHEFKKIIIVTGSFYNYLKSLNQLIETDKRVVHYHAVDEKKMLSLMLEAHLTVVPSSGILIEALAAGCKVISGYYVENQKKIYTGFLALNSFIDAGNFEMDNLKIAITHTIRNAVSASKIIDGKSGKNILLKILHLTSNIREVRESDCNLLFEWANNNEVRQNAISKEPVLWKNHLNWFNSKINSINSKIFILEYKNQPIGQIRYDKKDDYWTIDYSIDDKFRGDGFGKIMLERTMILFKENKLKALVKNTNIASVNIFKSLNFNQISSERINNEFYTTFQLQL